MSSTSPECILFAGPSLPAAARRPNGVRIRPPARRGEIAALIDARPPGVIALADGVFHQTLAVGHAELRDAVRRGWQVWGLSSLGAIRACEMRTLGVRGYGAVYQQFADDETFSDDEVALLHGPEPPYQAVSEPLIHLRLGLQALVAARVITAADRATLLRRLKQRWYGDRTLGFVRAAILAIRPNAGPALDRWQAGFGRHRIKTLDLERFLAERPWQRPATSGRRSTRASAPSGPSGTKSSRR
jgi:hypothetical protein